MKRIILLIALLLLASTVFSQADFPPPIPEDQEVDLNFYTYNLTSALFGEGVLKLVEAANEALPNINVEALSYALESPIASVQANIVAGEPIGAAQLTFNDLDFIVNNFPIVPLDELVSPEELEAHLDGMHPNAIRLCEFNGRMYCLPYTFSTPVLFYNADLFRAAGLDPDVPPTNWGEVLEYGQQIVENTDAMGIYVGMTGASAGDWMTQAVLLSNGARLLSKDRTTLTFAEPEAIEAIQTIRDLVDAGIMENMDINTQIQSMLTGQLAMYIQSSALQSVLIGGSTGNFELRAAPMPGFGENLAVPTNSGSALFVISDDPLEQRAAWEFMKFVTSAEGYTIITRDIGYLPLRPAIVEDPNYLSEWVAENPLVLPNLEQLERLQPWESLPGPNYSQIATIFNNAIETAIYGGGDVAEVLQQALARAQELMPSN